MRRVVRPVNSASSSLSADGERVPYSLGVNDGTLGGTISDAGIFSFDLNSFNFSAVTRPGAKLPSTGAGTFILMARYRDDDSVTATGNPDDMDAYLALEVGQVEP